MDLRFSTKFGRVDGFFLLFLYTVKLGYYVPLRCNAAFAILCCAEAAVPERIVRLYVVVTLTDLVIRPRGR